MKTYIVSVVVDGIKDIFKVNADDESSAYKQAIIRAMEVEDIALESGSEIVVYGVEVTKRGTEKNESN